MDEMDGWMHVYAGWIPHDRKGLKEDVSNFDDKRTL
jgi:hypothetical protein